ncbi:MAG: helix-turn-helix transcriptional regulator [bacterium]|nr:helix-turn-helix transcriptional regulator [bacterium]
MPTDPPAPSGRPKRNRPIDWLQNPSTWPDGPFQLDFPPEVLLACYLAKRLRAALDRTDVSYIARRADISVQTINNIAKGRTWGDLVSIARLERALDKRLWGYEHRRPPKFPTPLDTPTLFPPETGT